MPEETISGDILRFGFRSEDGAFAVVHLSTDLGLEFVAVGPLGHLSEGQHVSLTGSWMDHTTFGRQFRVKSFLVEDPRTLRGLERYLSSGAMPGMGPTMAKRIVAHFGLETLRILQDDPKQLLTVPGVGKKRLAQVQAHWQRESLSREVEVTLRGYGVGAALARRVVDRYGDQAPATIATRPYQLAAEVRGVGFRTADAIASAHGIAPDSPDRAAAAILHALKEAQGEGHCYLPAGELLARVEKLQVPLEVASEQLLAMASRGDVHNLPSALPDLAPVYLPGLRRAEERAARRMRALLEDPPDASRIELPPIESRVGLALAPAQRAAVALALERGVAVITGGPGTGKTTIVRVLLAAATALGQRWKLAAPTGRAARRLSEATGHPAATLHRLLEFSGHTRRFTRDFTNPLDADGVLVDEASMIDTRLLDDLLAALPPRCRLVLVGDADQLPSVGPGQALADILASGAVPVARLTEVYRQAAHSGIVRAAHRVNAGLVPASGGPKARQPQEEPPVDDFFLVQRDEAEAARQAVLEIVSVRLPGRGYDPLRDVQVLTPMHSGPLGTASLNADLQAILNPEGAAYRRGDREIREGDRVIQVRNDYESEVFNGDVGRVIAVSGQGVTVDFDGQRVSVSGERLDDVQLAYAISIHKSQGSEYPAVVAVLHRVHWIMLRRNLLYTAITRASRFCCVVGTASAVERAVSHAAGGERWTGLADLLRGS